MKGHVSKTRIPRSRLILSKGSEEKLLDAAVEKRAELRLSYKVPSPSPREPRDPSPVFSTKRRLNTPPQTDSLPAKRFRLKRHNSYTDSTPLRRSARLQVRQDYTNIEDPVQAIPPAPAYIYKLEAGNGSVPLKPKRYDLTGRNLRSFDKKNRQRLKRMGKAKSPSKGNGSLSVSSSSKSKTSTEGSRSDKSRTTSTTSSGFAVLALENGVLDRANSKAPTNLRDHRTHLNRSRETASPTESVYESYVSAVSTAPNEQTMIMDMADHDLLKKYDDKGYRKIYNQAFTAFPKEVGFNNGLSAPQPDLVEGLQRRQFKPFPAEQIAGAILFKDDPYSITLSHLAGEWKGPGKDMNQASLQSAFDGAALVYGRDQALEFLGSPDPPGHAVVSSFTTDGSNINFSTHYSAPSEEDGRIEYHQFPTTSTNLVNSFEEFKIGRKQLRNLQDDARRESYALKDRLNDHWKTKQITTSILNAENNFDGIVEEPHADPSSYLEGNDGSEELPRSTQDNHSGGEIAQADLPHAKDDGYKILDKPAYVPTPPRSSNQENNIKKAKQRRSSSSTRSPNADPFVGGSASGTSKKHKLSSHNNEKSKGKVYGKTNLQDGVEFG